MGSDITISHFKELIIGLFPWLPVYHNAPLAAAGGFVAKVHRAGRVTISKPPSINVAS
jgi:hypothetical protein